MQGEIKSGGFGGLLFLLVVCIAVGWMMFFLSIFNKPSKLASGEVITVDGESFIYLQADKWSTKQGAKATIEAIARFKRERPELCVFPWHNEISGETGNDIMSYGIWLYHKPKLQGGC